MDYRWTLSEGTKNVWWDRRRLFQETGKLDAQSDGILIILVADLVQLLPVTDKSLYYSIPSGNTTVMEDLV